MTRSFWQLFLMNLRLVYRDRGGLFWTLAMPSVIYVALSVLPIGKVLSGGSGGTAFNYSSYVLPGIIAMTVMQGGIYGLAYWMVDLKSRGVIKRFLVTPLSQTELVLSLLCARVLIALTQVAVLTLIGVIFFHAAFAGNILTIVIFTVLGGFTFLLVGLLISLAANSYQAAAPLTAAIGLPLTFLGNLFYPVDTLPGVLRTVAHLLPITYLADGLRQAYLAPAHWTSFASGSIARDFVYLAIWFVLILSFVLWRFRLEEV